ncbi:hypothetical protein V8E51_018951 [Hyaloscypha variabilis]|uniref:Secreted protein n=1 Tax=Hyaloscypha variabilis (strain UAMH 11265 / GT02V1 / F) TaxID=1149755 RepID=A0A2J6R8I2_HYAVF|nr:hypothetical protein L207DRAFT_127265 [Hyaloscypha variabilis F]
MLLCLFVVISPILVFLPGQRPHSAFLSNINLETSSLLGYYPSSPPVCWVMVGAPPLTPHPVVLSCHISPISIPIRQLVTSSIFSRTPRPPKRSSLQFKEPSWTRSGVFARSPI